MKIKRRLNLIARIGIFMLILGLGTLAALAIMAVILIWLIPFVAIIARLSIGDGLIITKG